jgi:hypothetical protein
VLFCKDCLIQDITSGFGGRLGNSSVNVRSILGPSERRREGGGSGVVLYNVYIVYIHCDQQYGNNLGIYIFKTTFEVLQIGIWKNENGGKNNNSLRIMPLLLEL